MGEHNVKLHTNQKSRAAFIAHLLDDIEALEMMLEQKMIETGITRIGAEQEFCLVDQYWRPSNNAEEILNDLNDSHFTTELAKYNLEINLDPYELKTDCFSVLENQLTKLLDKAKKVAKKHNSKVILTGILPTIRKKHIELDYMTPNPRYWALNEILRSQRGTDFELHIRGVDEISIHHESVLFEACNTSFQMHLQISPEDFISSYNWAQAISGPVLGISTNSPLLFGRELWSETRIALFRQSMDIRSSSYALKDRRARVSFSNQWASGSVADIFKNDIAQHKIVLSRDISRSSVAMLKNGQIPKLKALSLHNGTVYRWNRPCYGVGNGKPHVRIENRYIPSGPTIIDQVANFAFWAGLMVGRPSKYNNMQSQMDFRDAKGNFVKAARIGKESILRWMDNSISVADLVVKELLPIAYAGLEKVGVDSHDRERLLKIIEMRAKGISASEWNIQNYRFLKNNMSQDNALRALTKTIYENQQNQTPVHEWDPIKNVPKLHKEASLIGHIMSTQLFTVDEHDLATLATNIMKWKNIHHVPVESESGKLCGLLTWSHAEKYQKRGKTETEFIVSDIMVKEVITVHPNTPIQEAIDIMKKYEIGCLPVLQSQDLVGIVTIKDVIPFDYGENI